MRSLLLGQEHRDRRRCNHLFESMERDTCLLHVSMMGTRCRLASCSGIHAVQMKHTKPLACVLRHLCLRTGLHQEIALITADGLNCWGRMLLEPPVTHTLLASLTCQGSKRSTHQLNATGATSHTLAQHISMLLEPSVKHT